MTRAEREFSEEVQGQQCDEFMAQQCWRRGQLAEEWNVLFLKLRNGPWIRFFIDAGEFFWKKEKPSLPENADGNEYRLVKPSIADSINGRAIASAEFTRFSSGGRTLALELDNGMAIYLHNQDDHSSVVFKRHRAI